MKSYSRWTLMLSTIALTAACAGPVAQPRAESEAMARSRLMLARLDRLEADLQSEATATDTYAVLQERHGEASQMACKVTDEHVNEMHRLLVAQLEKRKEKLAQHNKKLASAARLHQGSTRGRSGHGKLGRASASARFASPSVGRASASSAGRAGSTPAAGPSRVTPAAQGRAPSAASRAPGKGSGALSMR